MKFISWRARDVPEILEFIMNITLFCPVSAVKRREDTWIWTRDSVKYLIRHKKYINSRLFSRREDAI